MGESGGRCAGTWWVAGADRLRRRRADGKGQGGDRDTREQGRVIAELPEAGYEIDASLSPRKKRTPSKSHRLMETCGNSRVFSGAWGEGR